MKYSIFLMDADNTLYDYDKAEGEAFEATFRQWAIPYQPETKEVYRRINKALWAQYERQEVTKDFLQRMRFVRLFEELGIHADGEHFNRNYLRNLAAGSDLIHGAEALCRELKAKGGEIYLATNGISFVQKQRISNSVLQPYVDGVFVSEDVGFQKPQAEYYVYIFDKINLTDKSKVLMVGDSLSADIQGGINVGISTCWYNPNGSALDGSILPTYQIQHLSELLHIVE